MATTQYDVAALKVIDLKLLVARERRELANLVTAAQSSGFFYLDLQNEPSARQLLDDLPLVYKLSSEYFDQPIESKLKDVRKDQSSSQDRGYKLSDCDETFEISYNEITQGTLVLPDSLNRSIKLLEEFSELCQRVCQTMLSSLSEFLPPNEADRYEKHHRNEDQSDSGLKLIYEPSLENVSDVGENKHTDSGTFTLTFCDQLGLHVQDPETKSWAFITPKDGCVLVNVADSLQRLSGGVLHAPLHRVTQPFDGFSKRYFLSYFLRPSHKLKESWQHSS